MLRTNETVDRALLNLNPDQRSALEQRLASGAELNQGRRRFFHDAGLRVELHFGRKRVVTACSVEAAVALASGIATAQARSAGRGLVILSLQVRS